MIWAYPVLVLHIVLLPCNLLRLCELWRAEPSNPARHAPPRSRTVQ
jgi:hypothetical protein